MAEYKVLRIQVLERMPRSREALELLQRVTLQVQPIMRKRQFTCPVVEEFFPENGNLLGLNMGGGSGATIRIQIRLRPKQSPDSFYDFNHVLGTMLHELVHNVRGPHDAVFNKLLDELWAEAEDLMDRGITGTGAGFDARAAGRAGNGDRVKPGTLRDRREAILQAAEGRAARGALMPAGPRTVGGGSLRHLSAAEAARSAAEARQASYNAERCGTQVGSAPKPAGPARSGGGAAAAAAARPQPAQPTRGHEGLPGNRDGAAGPAPATAPVPPGRRRNPDLPPARGALPDTDVVVVLDDDDEEEARRGAGRKRPLPGASPLARQTRQSSGKEGAPGEGAVSPGQVWPRQRRFHPPECACCAAPGRLGTAGFLAAFVTGGGASAASAAAGGAAPPTIPPLGASRAPVAPGSQGKPGRYPIGTRSASQGSRGNPAGPAAAAARAPGHGHVDVDLTLDDD